MHKIYHPPLPNFEFVWAGHYGGKMKLDIVSELEQLGLLTKKDGKIQDADKALLLKVYLAKMSGKTDIKKLGEDFDPSTKISDEQFAETGKIHEYLAKAMQQNYGEREKLGQCRSFENLEKKVKQDCDNFKLKQQEFDALNLLLSSESELSSLAEKFGAKDVQSLEKALKAKQGTLTKSYYKNKAERLSEATDYLIWLSVRAENFQLESVK